MWRACTTGQEQVKFAQKKGGMQFEVLNDPTEEIVPAGSLVGIKDIDFVGRSEAETP